MFVKLKGDLPVKTVQIASWLITYVQQCKSSRGVVTCTHGFSTNKSTNARSYTGLQSIIFSSSLLSSNERIRPEVSEDNAYALCQSSVIGLAFKPYRKRLTSASYRHLFCIFDTAVLNYVVKYNNNILSVSTAPIRCQTANTDTPKRWTLSQAFYIKKFQYLQIIGTESANKSPWNISYMCYYGKRLFLEASRILLIKLFARSGACVRAFTLDQWSQMIGNNVCHSSPPTFCFACIRFVSHHLEAIHALVLSDPPFDVIYFGFFENRASP